MPDFTVDNLRRYITGEFEEVEDVDPEGEVARWIAERFFDITSSDPEMDVEQMMFEGYVGEFLGCCPEFELARYAKNAVRKYNLENYRA